MFGIYAGITALFVGQNVARFAVINEPLNLDAAVYAEVLYWFWLALLTPWILIHSQKYRIERLNLRRTIPAHLLLMSAVIVAHLLLYFYSTGMLLGNQSLWELTSALPGQFSRFLVGSVTLFYKYCLIVAIYYTFDYYWRYRIEETAASENAVRASRLQAQLSNAELDTLRMQLHPHFLFNTLNTISVLMEEEPKKANRTLHHLSNLLRITLDSAGEDLVTLRQELAFVERYLEIEKIRFEDRLRIKMNVNPATLDTLVPNLILQPIVENAIRHGIAPSSDAGSLSIDASRSDGDLTIRVTDDGPGFPEGKVVDGIGLSNTRARLELRYGNTKHLVLSSGDDRGASVTITIPIEDDA